jgi:gluconokinase
MTYADTRNAADAQALRERLNEYDIHERTGCLLRTSYWPARLAWLRRVAPDIRCRAARFITLGEYLELHLFGEQRVSLSVASWSGLLNRTTLNWDAELLSVLELEPAQLAPLTDLDVPLRGLRPTYAARWPQLARVPWFPAIGDGAAANVGSGCVTPGRVALTIGSTGAIRVALPQVPEVPTGLWCYRIDRRLALLGGATSEGGNVFGWLRGTLQLPEPQELERAVAALPPDAHGLTVLPFWAGERSPGWAGDARATIHGMTLGTTPLEIVRACLEAIACRFALILAPIRTQMPEGAQLIASGGLLNSPAWMQILADVLGLPLVASAETEATCRGAALPALVALGALPSLAAAPIHDAETYTPNPEYHERYQVAVERQRALYDLVVTGG